jgi:hypothetical protein
LLNKQQPAGLIWILQIPPFFNLLQFSSIVNFLLKMSNQWQEICAARKKRQHDSIPSEWLIQLPPDDQLNVIDVPPKCGLLTPRELEITETVDVDVILHKLSTAEWSSVETTTAFLKRAIIAQQLASTNRPSSLLIPENRITDKLSHGNIRGSCPCQGKRNG